MNRLLRFSLIAATLAAPAILESTAFAQQARRGGGGRGGTRGYPEVVAAGADFLKKGQAEDGTWSRQAHAGITGMVLTGLFSTKQLTATDPAAVKGLAFVETQVSADEGHIGNVQGTNHVNYLTSVNLLAFKTSGDAKYAAVIANAVKYLKTAQADEGEMKSESDLDYGGFGYRVGTRSDMSNTHFALDALHAGGVAGDDPVFKKAVVFVSRAQNLASPNNAAPWAKLTNDGSFIYTIGVTTDAPVEARPGYGSMTYAGLKSLALCGVPKTDPRYQKAREWISQNYSVDMNPGRQEGAGGQGYFYYLLAMSKCLSLLGDDQIVDARGKSHDWRAEITRALSLRQRADGSWGNDFRNWMENNNDLDTAYALMTLSLCQPKAAP